MDYGMNSMPWSCYASMSDYDIQSIYYYLRAIPHVVYGYGIPE